MVKRTCAHAQWRKPAFKQPNGSISVRYNNLLDITLCMHEFDASFERRRIWGALKTFYRSRSFPAFYPSGEHGERILYVPEPSNLNWMGIFEINSSEFNEPCHEIHQNSNNDNCHQETNCWDWLKSFVVTDHRRKRNQRIICYVAGHAVALLYCVNKPAVVREKFVKIVTGLPRVPVTEELNFFENEYSKNQLFPPMLIFLLNM